MKNDFVILMYGLLGSSKEFVCKSNIEDTTISVKSLEAN